MFGRAKTETSSVDWDEPSVILEAVGTRMSKNFLNTIAHCYFAHVPLSRHRGGKRTRLT